MATSTSSFFSNGIPGENQMFPGNLYRLDATPKVSLGFRVSRADGNVYRYSHYGAATNRGLLVSQDLSETSQVDTDNGIVAPASASTTTDGTIGSRFIQITFTGVVRNQFAGGYLITTDDTGEGYTYRIKGNTAAGDPTTGDYRLELYDPLQVAVDATTDYSIVGCLWNDLEAATAATDIAVAGVSVSTTTAANPYAFTQTWGVCGVLQDANAPAAGDMVTLSPLTTGAIGAFVGGSIGTVEATEFNDELIVGYCIDPGDSTGHSAIYLQIAP